MIVDYSGPFPGGVALKNAGVTDIARYFNSGHSKCITQPEASGAHAVGIGIIALCETSADWLIQPANEVASTVLDCQRTAKNVGVSIRALYCAADWDVPSEQYSAVNAGLATVASIIGAEQVGLYGKRELLLYVQERNPGMWFMESAGWNDGPVPGFVHIAQTTQQITIAGTQCDVDKAQKTDYGQWPAPATGKVKMATLDAEDKASIEHIVNSVMTHHDASMKDTLEKYIESAFQAHDASLMAKINAAIKTIKS